MSDKNKLEVVDQREVTFYGDELIAVKAADGNIYVSFRHLCDALGVSRNSQVRRIKRQPILDKGYKGGAIMTPPSEEGVGGGRQQAGLLRVDLVPLWLAGIDTGRVNEDIRPKLERYQEEVARVLWEAFQAGRLTADPAFSDLLKQDTLAVQAYKTALAVVDLARAQVILESQLTDHEKRLEAIEAQLGDPDRFVTRDQASRISQAVKAVAMEYGRKTKRNEYGAVYGELYRKFNIPDYKSLPAAKFQAAMNFLTEWYQSLTDKDVPF